MTQLNIAGQDIEYRWGRCLVYDVTSKRAHWAWPVDAREGLVAGVLTAPPEGVAAPPHPEPGAKEQGVVAPPVQEAEHTMKVSTPAETVGATSPGPRIDRRPTAASAGQERG